MRAIPKFVTGALAVGIVAAAGVPARAVVPPEPSSVSAHDVRAMGASYVLDWSVTEDWQTGFQVAVKLTNSGTEPLDPWQVTIGWAAPIDSIWNAKATRSGGSTTLLAPDWATALAPGATADFGLVSKGSVSDQRLPSSCQVAGGDCLLQTHGTQPTPTPSSSADSGTPDTGTSTPATPIPLARTYRSAAYVDMAGWPVPDLAAIRQASRSRGYALGFITNSGACNPAWGGYEALRIDADSDQRRGIDASIAALRNAGGAAFVSFGGAAGTELALNCDEAQLKAAYRAVVEHYALDRIDFDIEGAAQSDRTANLRRARAVASLVDELSAAGRSLAVSLTLPVTPKGLTAAARGVIQDSIAAGMRIDLVNIMTMDYGQANQHMGAAAISAAKATAGQLALLYPGLKRAKRYTRMGITPMIGVNDTPKETFTVKDAKQLARWAKSHKVAELHWWSAGRDKPCPATECSGVNAKPWAFARALRP